MSGQINNNKYHRISYEVKPGDAKEKNVNLLCVILSQGVQIIVQLMLILKAIMERSLELQNPGKFMVWLVFT